MKVAAIYARKSTGQHVSEDDKSVARQVHNARAFADAHGWTVTEEFIDDGVSGAETRKLLQKQRMLEQAARGEFQIVIMQAQDRFSRRDGEEALAELKQLARHVEIWFYASGSRFESGTFASNTLSFLTGEFAAEYRRNIAAKTHEAMRRRAEQGFVTGGRTFGYDHVRMNGHVERRINDGEADVVRDIYRRYANGDGFKQIAHALNAQGMSSPRPQRGRPSGWDPGTVRAVLRRALYRGTIVYDKTKKRDHSGSRHRGRQPKKPQSQWLTVDAPQLRLVDPTVIALVDARLDQRRHAYLRDAKGHLLGSPRRHGHGPVTRLLAGFLQCTCGATFEAVRGVYVCSARRRKGASVCPSELTFNVEAIDHVFLDALEDVVLAPTFIDRVLDSAFATAHADDRQQLLEERQRLAGEVHNLTAAIAAGGDIPALATALAERDKRLTRIDQQLARPPVVQDREALKAALELRTADWRGILRGPHIAQARVVLQHLLELPIRVINPTPQYVDTPGVLWGDPRESKWIAAAKPEGLAVGLVQSVASPMPVSWNQIAGWLKQIDGLRQAA